MSRTLEGLSTLPAHRQFGMVLGLAVVAALGILVVMWAAQPAYQVLLPGMGERDVAQAMEVLARNKIPHRLDRRNGALTVPGDRIHAARLGLATEGLPRSSGVGFELLDQDTGLGTSRLQESVRHQRALEGELARSIVTLNSVAAARVHLALPRATAFVRERTRPSASVLVSLNPGRQLDEAQVAGIVHLVASSVPELDAEQVTVLDQRGSLLSRNGGNGLADAPVHQLDYTRRLEEALRERVEAILLPLLGPEAMRVQLTAEVDFTQVERTQEQFDPESPALRSEQTSEERSRAAVAAGVPGALSNQPPGEALVGAPGPLAEERDESSPLSSSRRSTRNFEVDRTVSHIRQQPARLQRLSVAVVVDHREVAGEDGQRARVPRDEAEMEHLRSLVREAIGFKEERGDRVSVVNASFREIEVPALVEEPQQALWHEPWVQNLARQGLAGLGLLLLVLLVLRPALMGLARQAPAAALAATGVPATLPAPLGTERRDPAGGAALAPAGQSGRGSAEELARARQVAEQDPRLVAQVVRQWMSEDDK